MQMLHFCLLTAAPYMPLLPSLLLRLGPLSLLPPRVPSLLHHLYCCLLTCSRLADLQVPRTQVHMAAHLPIDTQRNFNTGCAYLIVHD